MAEVTLTRGPTTLGGCTLRHMSPWGVAGDFLSRSGAFFFFFFYTQLCIYTKQKSRWLTHRACAAPLGLFTETMHDWGFGYPSPQAPVYTLTQTGHTSAATGPLPASGYYSAAFHLHATGS